MKTRRRRKQKFSLRVEENTMSSSCDPFLSAQSNKESYLCEDPLLIPADWGIENVAADRSGASSLDMCPTSDLYADAVDVNAILDMDFNDLLEDPPQENIDVFQDVRYTSTPKSRPPLEVATCSISEQSKRPHFHVLHDITDSINCSNNESFINLSNVLDTTPPFQSSQNIDSQKLIVPDLCTPPPSVPKKCKRSTPTRQEDEQTGRKVSIIRKRLPLRTPPLPTPEKSTISASNLFTSTLHIVNESIIRFSSLEPSSSLSSSTKHLTIQSPSPEPPPSPPSKESDDEQLTYYSGLNCSYNCIALLKHIKLQTIAGLSQFSMQMITLMRLRLDLQWKDIGFRYNISSEEVVRKIFQKTLEVFSDCLREFLPWHCKKRILRKNQKAFYVQSIRKHRHKVIVIIGDSRKPINFVSSTYPAVEDVLNIVIKECVSYFMKGDLICINDSYFRIGEEGHRLCISQIEKTTRLPNFSYGRDIITNMLSMYPLASIEPHEDLTRIVRVIGALTNINYLPTLPEHMLRTMYQRSADIAYKKVNF